MFIPSPFSRLEKRAYKQMLQGFGTPSTHDIQEAEKDSNAGGSQGKYIACFLPTVEGLSIYFLTSPRENEAAWLSSYALYARAREHGEDRMVIKGWQTEVLRFWFEELTREDWFSSKKTTDDAIRNRFSKLHESLRSAIPSEAFLEPEAALAAVIVFDQFSRNMFRGTAGAFTCDRLALAVAANALASGFDRQLADQQKHILYMPFMHSEALADQHRCVSLFEALGGDSVKYAIEHRDIIERFGRFPHRNRALGRKTTEQERIFLDDHKGFGQ